MMEVKHSTPLEFNDLVTSSNDLNNISSPLRETDRNQLEDDVLDKVELLPNLKSIMVEKEDVLKANEPITNGAIISSSINGSKAVTSPLPTAIDLEDSELDMATAITPELEDELLNDDEADVVDNLLTEVAPSDITATTDLVEAASMELEKTIGKPVTNNVDSLRDPGDDLDTLLSKINDIVEDCNVPTAALKIGNVEAENAAVENAAVENAVVKIPPVEDVAVENAAVEIPPVEYAPAEDVAVEDVAVEDAAVEDVASEDAAVEDVALEVAAIEDVTLEVVAIEDVALEDASVEDAAVENVAVKDVAVEDTAVKDVAVEDATVEDATVENAVVEEHAVAIDENAVTAEADTSIMTVDDSVIILEDSVYEKHIESKVNIKATEVMDTNEFLYTESASQNIIEQPAQVEMPEAEEPRKEDDAVIPMEQEEEITGSDQMILDVDLDVIKNEESAAKSAEPVTSIEPIQGSAPSPKSETDAEKIEDEKEKDTIPSVDSSLPATEEIKDDLETKEKKVSCGAMVSLETESKPEETVQPATVVTSVAEELTDNNDATATESTVDEVTEIDKEAINEKKAVKTPKEGSSTTEAPSSAINLDTEDSDDDIVFFYEKSKNADDTKQQAKSVHKDLIQKELESKTDAQQQEKMKEYDDDVVLLDDDDDDETEVAPAVKSSALEKEQSKMETDDNVKSKAATEEPPSIHVETVVKETTENKNAENQEVDAPKPECEKPLVDDNSDNARDKFGDAEIVPKQPEEETQPQAQKSADVEESNSNCSSSSNLLQESKAVASSEGGEEETDLGNDDDDDAADNDCEAIAEVEIIETDILDDESKEGDAQAGEDKDMPPAKRMRLSTADEDEESSSKISLDKADIEGSIQKDASKIDATAVAAKVENVDSQETKTDGEKISNKRAHEDSLVEFDELKKESDVKKLKTEEPLQTDEIKKKEIHDEEVEDSKSDIIEIKDGKEDEENLISTEINKEEMLFPEELPVVPKVKAVPSHIPVPLYPPPVFEEPAPKFSYDFLKRFKKSLDKLTKIDLEELVMQKIAESIIHKSEFGEMRELIEKQEKTISTHRTKITELSKQFRDLEMVHNRVLKDIETKNSQFLMPVKITRAVGLQVFIPLKKNSDPASNAAANSVSVSSPQQTSQQSPQYRSIGNSSAPPPLTSPLRQSNNIDSSSSTVISSSSASLIRSSNALASATAAASLNTRRGCAQKVTPQRPMETASLTTSQVGASAGSALYRGGQSNAAVPQQTPAKLLNKSASASAIAQMRNRYSGGGSSTPMQQPQQTGRQQPSPTNNVRKVVPPLAKQPSSSNISQQYRRSEPTPQTSISPATASDNYVSSAHQLPTGLPAVSITPAKPKDKSVIDLTDEDDAPTSVTPTPTAIRQRPTNTPVNSSTGGSSNSALNKTTTSYVRVQSTGANNQPKTAPRQQVSTLYGSKSNGNSPIPTNISTPPGTSITRIQVNANMQRIKYGHPAPLPPTPAQNLHPAWKLPPPRPTIRISNLDNGIVISWTVEESMDRHADCVSYQIYAYQETSGPPLIDSWRHVGDVKAMLLPMAVTLTQFQEGQRYFFAVRAVDVHHRVGPFSVPKTWS